MDGISLIAEARRALPGIARQLAAAFGAFGQGRAIPAAAQGLHKRHCVHHSSAENSYRSKLVRKGRTLRRGHFQVAGDATLVPRDGKFEIFLCCGDGSFLQIIPVISSR